MSKIAVDVTPLLPGGTNGGAKPMVVALLQELPHILPDDEFILLTADYSHDELAFLDRPNLRRVCVENTYATANQGQGGGFGQLLNGIRLMILRWLPQRVKGWLRSAYYRMRPVPTTINTLVKQLDIDFLFCPFSAPRYYDPNVPALSVIYDLQFLDYPVFFTENERFYRQLHFDQICQLADHVATISEFTRQSVLKNSSFPPENVTTIHIGLVHDFTDISSMINVQNVFNKLGIQTQRYLFYPANFWAHKNHQALLQAFQLFRQKFPESDLKLVFTGALDDRRAALSVDVKRLGLSGYIVTPGFLPDQEVGILFQGARGLIFPSLYEGFGIPVLEAMEAGIPVACSNVTSLPEIGGDAVLYFDPENVLEISQSIEALEFNESLRTKLIKMGRERLRLFGDAQVMAKKYGDLIHRMINGKREIHAYGVHGLTEDRWFQETAYLAIPAAIYDRVLDLSIIVPDWMPGNLKLTVLESDQQLAEYDCIRGKMLSEAIPLPLHGGVFEFRFSPAYSPASLGVSNDLRFLSTQCESFQIRKAEGPLLFDVFHKDTEK